MNFWNTIKKRTRNLLPGSCASIVFIGSISGARPVVRIKHFKFYVAICLWRVLNKVDLGFWSRACGVLVFRHFKSIARKFEDCWENRQNNRLKTLAG